MNDQVFKTFMNFILSQAERKIILSRKSTEEQLCMALIGTKVIDNIISKQCQKNKKKSLLYLNRHRIHFCPARLR